jgi:hypothetical protein
VSLALVFVHKSGVLADISCRVHAEVESPRFEGMAPSGGRSGTPTSRAWGCHATSMTQPSVAPHIGRIFLQDAKTSTEPDVSQEAVQAQSRLSSWGVRPDPRLTSRSKSKEHEQDQNQGSQSGTGTEAILPALLPSPACARTLL